LPRRALRATSVPCRSLSVQSGATAPATEAPVGAEGETDSGSAFGETTASGTGVAVRSRGPSADDMATSLGDDSSTAGADSSVPGSADTAAPRPWQLDAAAAIATTRASIGTRCGSRSPLILGPMTPITASSSQYHCGHVVVQSFATYMLARFCFCATSSARQWPWRYRDGYLGQCNCQTSRQRQQNGQSTALRRFDFANPASIIESS
jgi:hypothetical protein